MARMIESACKTILFALAALHLSAWAAAATTPTAPQATASAASGGAAPALPSTKPQKAAIEPQAQRIHVEDGGAAIDELRVGGQTRRIDVQPKGGMPAYQVAPQTGERSWKVLGF